MENMLHMEKMLHNLKVLDGGIGMLLARNGSVEIHDSPLWSASLLATKPSAIKEAHKQFLEAGADIIETATYQASVEGLCSHLKLAVPEAEDLLRRSVELATEARDDFWRDPANHTPGRRRPEVAVSFSSYGGVLGNMAEYSGDFIDTVDSEVIAQLHRDRLKAVVGCEADYVAFETIPAVEEAAIIVDVLKEFPSLKAWIAFACKSDHETCRGDNIGSAVSSVLACPQIVACGVNCTVGWRIPNILKEIRRATVGNDKPIVVYPNADKIWEGEERVYNQAGDLVLAERMGEFVPSWVSGGASWIGGCCHVFPEHISRIREAMERIV